MHNPADLIKIPILTENYFWSASLTGVRFGENQENAFGFTKDQWAITDSGTSCLLIPAAYYSLVE